MDDLEKEFKVAAIKINEKIKEAASAMKEANDLAKAAGITNMSGYLRDWDENLSEEEEDKIFAIANLIDIYPLFNELDEAGWATSSIGC